MTTKPRYLVTIRMGDGTLMFEGGADNLLLRREGDHPTLAVVVAESMEAWAKVQKVSDALTSPTDVSSERAAFFADKRQHLLGEIEMYESTHPDDAPCLDSAPLTIDAKPATLRIVEKGLH